MVLLHNFSAYMPMLIRNEHKKGVPSAVGFPHCAGSGEIGAFAPTLHCNCNFALTIHKTMQFYLIERIPTCEMWYSDALDALNFF